MTIYDDPDNYSISVLWRTDQRVSAIKALHEAGRNHNLTISACKQALDLVLNDGPWLHRNTTLILRASSIQKELDAERERSLNDAEMLLALKGALSAVPTSGHEYDEYGHYVGAISTDEDYATLGRAVLTIYSHYITDGE